MECVYGFKQRSGRPHKTGAGNRRLLAYLWHKAMENSMSNMDTAIIAGGCFWCTEAVFRDVVGVSEVESGYIGGTKANPTYKEVCTGTTGHAEGIRVTFDPAVISLAEVYDVFLGTHDPTQLNRQGGDVGTQYRSAIFPCRTSRARKPRPPSPAGTRRTASRR